MDNENRNGVSAGEVDLFDLGAAPPAPFPHTPGYDHIETETGAFDFDKSLRLPAAQRPAPVDDAADFDPAPAAVSGGIDPDDPDDDFEPKEGLLSRLFNAAGALIRSKPYDPDMDSDDSTPPQPATPTDSGVFELNAVPQTPPPQPATPTDSGVFELSAVPQATPPQPATPTDSGVFELSTVPQATPPQPATPTDSGVFELSAVPQTTPPQPATPTDSGVFELSAVPQTTPPQPATPTDSGVFELNAVPQTTPPQPATPTDSGVFELNAVPQATPPQPATPTDTGVFELNAVPQTTPTAPQSGGDEWEIGWEPEKDADEKDSEPVFDSPAPPEPEPAVAARRPAEPVPPPVFSRIAHVCIYVENLERSVEFYAKLGFRKRFAFNRGGKLFGIYLEFGEGNFVELFEDASRDPGATRGRLAHFCLETPDINAAMRSLEDMGIEFSPNKLGCDSTYQIWLKDPDGNDFEIHQYTPESAQVVGGDVEADW